MVVAKLLLRVNIKHKNKYICLSPNGCTVKTHLAWVDQRSRTHLQDTALPENCALNRCEECFNWVWMVDSLYMDSPGCMKHSYRTQNLCTKQQDKGKNRLAYSPYSTQSRHMQICWWRYTFEWLQPLTESSNAWTTRNIVNTRPRNSVKRTCMWVA